MLKAQYDLNLEPAESLRRYGLRKAIRIACNRAGSPVKGSVVQHAHAIRRYGFLAKAIRIKVIVYPSDYVLSVFGPSTKYVRTKGKFKRGKRKGKPRKHQPSRVAHLVEKGTKRSTARPWLKPAARESTPAWLPRVTGEINKEIALELARQSKG